MASVRLRYDLAPFISCQLKEIEAIPVGHPDEEPRIDIHLYNQYGDVWIRFTEKELRYALEMICQNSAKSP
jgi:hypothetical protein